jgi:hypothetical protein
MITMSILTATMRPYWRMHPGIRYERMMAARCETPRAWAALANRLEQAASLARSAGDEDMARILTDRSYTAYIRAGYCTVSAEIMSGVRR